MLAGGPQRATYCMHRPRIIPCLLLLSACSAAVEPQLSRPEAAEITPNWAQVLERQPDPEVVTDAKLYAALLSSELPWRVRDKDSGIELLLVPAGAYTRGAEAADEEAFADERPAHRVRIEQPFYLGRFEVRQTEWMRVMGEAPSHFTREEGLPVEQITYLQVRDFAERSGLRAPTEAEWEYACRAGSTGPRYAALDSVAWYSKNADFHSHPVGLKVANPLGFHDMLGNVWEWTSTWYEPDFYAACAAGVSADEEPPGGLFAVLRGGSWYTPVRRVRSSARYRGQWTFSAGHVGLRVARDPE